MLRVVRDRRQAGRLELDRGCSMHRGRLEVSPGPATGQPGQRPAPAIGQKVDLAGRPAPGPAQRLPVLISGSPPGGPAR